MSRSARCAPQSSVGRHLTGLHHTTGARRTPTSPGCWTRPGTASRRLTSIWTATPPEQELQVPLAVPLPVQLKERRHWLWQAQHTPRSTSGARRCSMARQPTR